MQIYGNKLTVDQLRRRVGSMDQIAGVRMVQLDDGNERPSRAAFIHTGSGLEFMVMLDRGLDISLASFQGKSLSWRSTVGDVAPQYYEAEGLRWLRSYFGGLMTTCGLTNVGGPAADSPSSGNGLHGRIGNLPAKNLRVSQEWQGNDYVLSVTGTMRETVVFGENLTLTRTVSAKLGEKRLRIQDVLTNEGFNTTKFMLLYHCNIGWPVVDAGSRIIAPSKTVFPLTETARDGQEQWNRLDAPTHGYGEKVYYHDMAPQRDGSATVAIVNEHLGDGPFGVYVKYNKNELPRFTQWKMMGEQDYVVGLEPCTCGVQGRAVDEQLGLMHSLKPGERRTFNLEFGAITTAEEVKAVEAKCRGIKASFTADYRTFVRKP